MIVLGNIDTYNFCIPKCTKATEPYEVVHSPRLYDVVDLERAIYEMARGRVIDNTQFLEKSGLFGRESGREAFKLLTHIGVANFYEDVNKNYYCLSGEGIEVIQSNVRGFLEVAILRYSPYLFVYDYIKNELNPDKRTQREIIAFFNRKHPKYGSGDSGSKNIQSILIILESYGYINSFYHGRLKCYEINKNKLSKMLDLEHAIYMTIDDSYHFYQWLKNRDNLERVYPNLYNLLGDKQEFINEFSKIIYQLKFLFIYNNFEKTTFYIDDNNKKEFLDNFALFLKDHPDTYNIDYIKKLTNDSYELNCYLDIVFKSDKIENYIGFTRV